MTARTKQAVLSNAEAEIKYLRGVYDAITDVCIHLNDDEDYPQTVQFVCRDFDGRVRRYWFGDYASKKEATEVAEILLDLLTGGADD